MTAHQVITQDGEPVYWTAHYWRHRSQHEQECPTLAEAVSFLVYGSADGNLAIDHISDAAGETVLTRDQIDDLEPAVDSGRLDEALYRLRPAIGG